MVANRIGLALAASLVMAGCAYGTIRNVPDEMIAEQEEDRDLVAAILTGNLDHADYLLSTGADVDQAGEAGATPLIAAARTGATGLAARLLELGARSDAKDAAGKNALAYALEQDNEAMVTLLVEHAKSTY